MAQEHELRLKINASAAKSGAAQFKGAIASIQAAVTKLDKDTQGAFSRLNKGATVKIDSKAAKQSTLDLKRAEKGVNSFAEAQKKLALSSASALRTSVSQFDRLYEKAERLGDTSGIRQMDQALAQLEIRLKKATTPLDVRVARSQFADTATDVMRTNRQLEIQERKANIAAASMNKLNTTVVPASRGFGNMSNMLRQTSFQLSQVAQQGAVTGDYLRAAAIQIPDLLLPFGTVAILGGAVLGALAPVAIEMMGGADAAKVFDDRLKNLQETQTALTQVTDTLKMTTSELVDKYGDGAQRVREFAVAQAQLKLSGLAEQMSAQSNALKDVTGQYTSATNGGHSYRNALRRISGDFSLTTAQAREFETALESVRNAQTFDAQVSAMQDVNNLLKEAGVSLADIPPEVANALSQMIDLSNETAATEKLAADLAAAASDIAPNLDPAVTTAIALKTELAAALSLFNRISSQDSLTYSGRGGDPRQFENGPQYTRELSYKSPQDYINEHTSKLARASRSGGGGSRKAKLTDEQKALEKSTDAIQNRYRALQAEARALELVGKGQFQTIEAAKLYADSELSGVSATDKKTQAMLRQIDAVNALEDAKGTDLITAFNEGLRDSTKSAIEGALNGDLSLESFTQNIRSKMASVISDKLTENLFPSLSKTGEAAKNAALMRSAMVQGGTQAAAQISAAMGTSGVRTAAVINASGTGHATKVGTAIQTSGQAHAAAVAGATQSGGGGGFLSYVGSLFGVPSAAQGMTTSGVPAVASATVSPAMFTHAPHYKDGTANTSGIPSILHENEAVIPLSKGRKVGVELNGAGQSGNYSSTSFNGGINVNIESRRDGENDEMFAQRIAENMQEQLAVYVDGRIAESQRYGGIANPR